VRETVTNNLLERDDQLRQLAEAFDSASAGRGRLIALGAEAGAGKTALTERFVADHAQVARTYWGACENLSTPEVLLPLRDIARSSGNAFVVSGDHIESFEALLRLISNGSKPAVVVIEDVHWADTATLDLIRFLGRRVARLRALMLITYRDEEVDARSPVRNLLGELPTGNVERIALAPLSLAAVSRLAAERGRRGEELFAITAGNPFLVTEALAVDGDLPNDAVRDSTLARASRLSDPARNVLDAVAIFPRRAETALIADLVKKSIDAGLDECVEKGMLSLEGAIARFRHELARRAIEGSIPAVQRRALHQNVVDVLKRRSDARPGEIAHHAERAGDVPALLKFALIAGGSAARDGAPREAAAHFAAMLRHRTALGPALLVEVLERYAEQTYLAGAADLAMSSMAEASELRRNANDTVALGRNLTRLTRFAWMCGRRAEAERFVRESIAVLETAPPGAELAWAYSHQSQLDMLASRMDSAITWGERALQLARRLGEQEIIVHALGNIGSATVDHSRSGKCPQLEESFALAVANRFHDHVERASCNLTCTHYWRRDYQASLSWIERGVSYATALELNHWEGYLRGWRSMVRLDQGHWEEAEEEAREICSRTFAADVYRFPALIALARLRVRRGDPDFETPLEAARRLSVAMAELQRSVYVATTLAESEWLDPSTPAIVDSRPLLWEVHQLAREQKALWVTEDAAFWLHMLGERVEGTANIASPFREHLEGNWRAAAAGWRVLGRPYEEALALSGGDDGAQREALEIFDRLGAVPAAARVRRQMRTGGARAVPRGPIGLTRANSAGLTRRQVQVLGLLDEGLSNAEIATRLCISAKTAEHHVAAVMARLESPTRKAAGCWALPKNRDRPFKRWG
jgi:DNA-binding CsgD family transcriptional regulator/tetratricopeptide (TPR) repeat protein